MIRTFMPETRAVRSKGWQIALLGLACCAAEADVLSDRAADVPPSPSIPDGGALMSADAGRAWEAGPYAGDTGGLGGLRDAGTRPTWTRCDLSIIFERGRTGDLCDFGRESACKEQLPECAQRTAACADGVLHLGHVSKSECTPDDRSNLRRCAMVEPDSCCVDLWECTDAEADPAGKPVVHVCAPECDTTATSAASQSTVTGCPNQPDTPPWPRIWPPPMGMSCAGNFVCDAVGNAAGPNTVFQFGDQGLIYWCNGAVVLRAAIGNTWPWSQTPTL